MAKLPPHLVGLLFFLAACPGAAAQDRAPVFQEPKPVAYDEASFQFSISELVDPVIVKLSSDSASRTIRKLSISYQRNAVSVPAPMLSALKDADLLGISASGGFSPKPQSVPEIVLYVPVATDHCPHGAMFCELVELQWNVGAPVSMHIVKSYGP